MLRQFESLSQPCCDKYAKDRMAEILKAMRAVKIRPVSKKNKSLNKR
jgi:hypothetical protein